MKRNTWNFWIDFLLLGSMLGLVLTGFLIYWVLPPGSGRLRLWDLTRHAYGDIHFYLSLGMITLAFLHLFLHWKWVLGTFKNILILRKTGVLNRSQRVGAYGLVFMVAMILGGTGLLFWARSQVEGMQGESSRYRYYEVESGDREHVTGQWTLRQVAQVYEVDLEQLVHSLPLPTDVDADERLGPLRQQYGFEIPVVRVMAEQLQAQKDKTQN